ncbi:LOW QUALITY PROTEIN: heterogeneous nuclear ribonucleoprotein 27C-like [Mytilus californianus]|uniref:LOW QUALITY PROTEIN: heterogeneous nuclear ribonucleoprotein 27C-like n=1 Tax=Mytilus californianus TaxID=6549 RepID=UPI002247DA56|nr:LOW QUALITY PROTEIN: heterogeneous nuclear ribonucleoprotein 27C-like [Mytilus californianus]
MAGRDDPGKFFVGNLSWETDNDSLWQYFNQYGTVTDAVVIIDRQTGRSRGFGFVTFQDPSRVSRVIDQVHKLDGREINARPCNKS